MVLCRLRVFDQPQCEARRPPHRRIAETVLDAVVTLDAFGYRLRALDLDCPHGVCSVLPDWKAPVRRTLASSTQAELVTTARQGSDAAVPVGSQGCGARVGGRAGVCGPGRRVGGDRTFAVSGDGLSRTRSRVSPESPGPRA
jgi:hypothetical protein